MKISERREPFADSRETVASAVVTACERLTSDALGGYAAPTLENVRAVLDAVTTSRVSANVREKVERRNRWRFLRNARTADTVGRVFLNRLRWHTGTASASLWTLYGDRMDVGAETFEALDTIGAVYVELFSRRGLATSNSERWRGILGNSGRSHFIVGKPDASDGGTS